MMDFKDERRNLYLYNCDTSELIAKCITYEEATKLMAQYLNKVNFKSYYWRFWDGSINEQDSRMVFDFGSHIKFFHWAFVPAEDFEVQKEPNVSYGDFEDMIKKIYFN